jgi:hypothetical protein
VAHIPPAAEPLEAQAPEQHTALLVHPDDVGMQAVPSEPESGGPEQQELSCWPQLFTQLPEQPLTVQHVSLLVQTAPPEQLHAWGTPHESATETLHWFAQLLAGVQHLLLDPHSSPFGQPPEH